MESVKSVASFPFFVLTDIVLFSECPLANELINKSREAKAAGIPLKTTVSV